MRWSYLRSASKSLTTSTNGKIHRVTTIGYLIHRDHRKYANSILGDGRLTPGGYFFAERQARKYNGDNDGHKKYKTVRDYRFHSSDCRLAIVDVLTLGRDLQCFLNEHKLVNSISPSLLESSGPTLRCHAAHPHHFPNSKQGRK